MELTYVLICLNSIFSKSQPVSPPLYPKWPAPRHMVLRPHPAKNANFSIVTASRVVSLPQ